MKHFEIDYFVGSHAFTLKCSTAYEALDAIADILSHSHLDSLLEQMDRIMRTLLEIKAGRCLLYSTSIFAIRYLDGEV